MSACWRWVSFDLALHRPEDVLCVSENLPSNTQNYAKNLSKSSSMLIEFALVCFKVFSSFACFCYDSCSKTTHFKFIQSNMVTYLISKIKPSLKRKISEQRGRLCHFPPECKRDLTQSVKSPLSTFKTLTYTRGNIDRQGHI